MAFWVAERSVAFTMIEIEKKKKNKTNQQR